jgi:DNA-binding response OmpR family regulator
VVLPIATAGDGDAPSVDFRVRETTNYPSLNILLVEDHEDTAQTLRDTLVGRGHRVRVAATVEAALREAAADPCELLISDIGLPDGTGVDLLRQIQPLPIVGAIAMSGFGMENDQARSRDAGFARHLTKPVDFALLEETIAELSTTSSATPQSRVAGDHGAKQAARPSRPQTRRVSKRG